ncbi:VapC toxin family PIN domain ribonuclease [Candidatus Gottesmanbacteria bacterium CG_4_10_14_0_8_um_filter_37_24]|uniref:VapC toxin family PIN domain ribonuclease n=2 Tax=Candidatus Gottesmaniibacteriota TaxID=1752720 RepID=A0A2M7RQP9_9BACT|nr:MAG: hypothetical protein AUJ73_00725 [Candidatus Gottesmanbacteria bacterium CG1_02_37_22]PIP33236.1 MAG: VapC toxin family PIN domain ribonuclease [Candidatus Gottesmanbacteria bacterium CG23_combo_of_CG06-09_8_20_14_all_37_19]PIZ02405.1 MAG: VapC toxin family PIN domain ribonuclease [Candidatus Gottesmanbacteria bacterium CG_4_10_14_0_8_um_filter_37_24]
MTKYFLETSVIINYLRGKKGAAELIEGLNGELVSSYVCLSELFEGIYRAKEEKEKLKKSVEDFFKGLNSIFGVDEDIAEDFGEIREDLKQKGKVIEDLDILLAATCRAYGLIMVTENRKHFGRVKGLEIFSGGTNKDL